MTRALAPGGAVLLCVTLVTGCGGRYALRTEHPGFALQWPYQPGKAKVTYVESMTGLGRRKGVGSALRAVVYGSDKKDLNAFVLPVAVATGDDGRIAVADMGRRCVHLFLPAAERYLRLTGEGQDRIASPVAVIFGDDLTLYLSDSSGKVFAFDKEGAQIFIVRSAGAVPLRRPTGLAYSPGRQLLYVVDTLANEVYAFGKNGEFSFAFGGRGVEPGQFNFPTHIARSPGGELFVTDSLNFRVAIFDETGKPLGMFGRHGDGSGDMAMPKGLAVDDDGVIYVVDSMFDNVQLFNRRGEFLLTLGGRGTDFGEFWLPSGIFIDGKGGLYVCDTYNRRVQVFRIAQGYEPTVQ